MLVTESWVNGREVEHTDYKRIEVVGNKTYIFFLPWYACFSGWANDLFIGLDNSGNKIMRSSTMLEF